MMLPEPRCSHVATVLLFVCFFAQSVSERESFLRSKLRAASWEARAEAVRCMLCFACLAEPRFSCQCIRIGSSKRLVANRRRVIGVKGAAACNSCSRAVLCAVRPVLAAPWARSNKQGVHWALFRCTLIRLEVVISLPLPVIHSLQDSSISSSVCIVNYVESALLQLLLLHTRARTFSDLPGQLAGQVYTS